MSTASNISEQYHNLSNDSDTLYDYLRKVESISPSLTSGDKSAFLESLLADLKTNRWNEKLATQALSTIRILGRDPTGSEPLFTKEGISALVQYAFKANQVKDTPSSQEALKCIANCIHLNEGVKAYLEEDDVIGSCQYLLLHQSDDISLDSQFLTCRILFFLSVSRSDLVTRLVDADIHKGIEKILSRNIATLENATNLIDRTAPINPSTVITEALKLLFNLLLVISRNSEAEKNTVEEKFESCLVPIFHLLFKVPYAEPQPLVPPHSQAIHVLLQFPYTILAKVWKSQSDWTQQLVASAEENHTFIATTLVNLLDRAIHNLIPNGDPDEVEGASQIDATISPLLLVLRSLAEGDLLLAKVIAKILLPTENDRLVPVHEGFGLPAYMIRLMTCTMMPLSRDGVCETLFTLCDKDAHKFTQQVGYGNAIGFLVNKGIAMEPPKEEYGSEQQASINPITGQYVAAENEGPALADMTDEEKEREAERLFVLFERLKKTGIIDVENPIAKAMQESQGRFEEIHSSDEDSD